MDEQSVSFITKVVELQLDAYSIQAKCLIKNFVHVYLVFCAGTGIAGKPKRKLPASFSASPQKGSLHVMARADQNPWQHMSPTEGTAGKRKVSSTPSSAQYSLATSSAESETPGSIHWGASSCPSDMGSES